MSSTKVRKAVEDYFRSMNSITEKLVEDIQFSCKEEGGWGLFTNEEQSAIQWRKLIDPCLEEKYKSSAIEDNSVSCFPVLIVNSGEKLIIDEDTSNGRPFGSSWKDEHSAPFSWETKSQLNLLLDESGDATDGQQSTPKTPPSARSFIKAPTPKVTPRPSPKPSPALTRKSIKVPPEQLLLAKPKIIPSLHIEIAAENVDSGKESVISSEETEKDVIVAEKPNLPDKSVASQGQLSSVSSRQEEKIVEPLEANADDFHMDVETPSKGIPKTGFDFLDNW